MTNVNKIKAVMNMSGGMSLPCHYICNISAPNAFLSQGKIDTIIPGASTLLGPVIGLASRQISMLAESTTIPGRQLATQEHRIFGTTRKMPYGVIYDDLTVTFMCTNSMLERTFFDIWHQFIISPGSQYMEYYTDYVSTITIQKLDNSWSPISFVGSMISTYTLEEAYPVSIQAQELSYDATDQYLKLTVQFAYSKWKCTLDRIFPGDPNVDSPFF
jgi:hypothetical protein